MAMDNMPKQEAAPAAGFKRCFNSIWQTNLVSPLVAAHSTAWPVDSPKATAWSNSMLYLGVSTHGGGIQNGWFLGKITLKLMIWGYPYFRKPPFGNLAVKIPIFVGALITRNSRAIFM